jgi:putative intracellular protease/amidase
MRKISIFAIMVILSGIISFSSQAFGQGGSKVLLIPREGSSLDLDLMIKMEVGVMTILLKNAGLAVDIATTSGRPILGHTEKIEKVMFLSDVKLDEYAGVIMPCMAVGGFPGPPVSPEAVAVVKKALGEEKPVAASTYSVIILAEAGVLKGKKYAFPRDPFKPTQQLPRTDPRFEGAIYGGPGVVQDGKIITSGICSNLEKVTAMPSGTIELTKIFIAAIGPK